MRQELAKHAKGRDAKGQAAKYFDGPDCGWLIMAPPVQPQEIRVLEALLERLKELELEKAQRLGRRAKSHPKANLGEAESILHAIRHGHAFLAHDNTAKRVAWDAGLQAGTIVDVVKWMVSRGANAYQLAEELKELQAVKIDTGLWINSVLDLTPAPR
ncbi:hypothetical protein [Micromonospora sp. NPDC050495]|uniref:hypothetical protein n=1 Tax=Micromonospora sp. NPDC050495 TaxID=3154936 RepID=UPI0034112D80